MTEARERSLSDVLLAAALVPVGALVAIAGVATSAVAVGQWTERRAYVSARPCDGGTEGCYRDLDSVVERRWEERSGRRNRSTSHHVDLHVPDPELLAAETADGIVVATPNDAYFAMSPGRSVTVRMWEGEPARLTVPGAGSVETKASPLTRAMTLATLAPLLLTGGAAASYTGYAVVREDGAVRSRRRLRGVRARLRDPRVVRVVRGGARVRCPGRPRGRRPGGRRRRRRLRLGPAAGPVTASALPAAVPWWPMRRVDRRR